MEVLAKPNQLLIFPFRSQLFQDIGPGAAQTSWAGMIFIQGRSSKDMKEKEFGSYILGARPDGDDWFIQKRKNDQTS